MAEDDLVDGGAQVRRARPFLPCSPIIDVFAWRDAAAIFCESEPAARRRRRARAAAPGLCGVDAVDRLVGLGQLARVVVAVVAARAGIGVPRRGGAARSGTAAKTARSTRRSPDSRSCPSTGGRPRPGPAMSLVLTGTPRLRHRREIRRPDPACRQVGLANAETTRRSSRPPVARRRAQALLLERDARQPRWIRRRAGCSSVAWLRC